VIVIGVNGVDGTFHDSSASIFLDGKLVFSIEEERLNRKKHSDGVPINAFRECLQFVGAKADEVDAVGFYLDVESLYRNYFMRTVETYWPRSFNLYKSEQSFKSLLGYEAYLRKKLNLANGAKVHLLNHHLCHAASAFHFSNYSRAAVLVVDGSGDDETASLYVASNCDGVKKVATFSHYPQSLGFFYASIADYIGLGWIEGSGKMMGLAPYGEAVFYDALKSIVFRNGLYDIDMKYFTYYLNSEERLAPQLKNIFGIPKREKWEPLLQVHADIAKSAQLVLEDALVFLAEQAKILTGEEHLCYAGGVALNIDANSRVYQQKLFKSIAIHPAGYDGGTSIGAGYLAHVRTVGQPPVQSSEVFLGTKMETAGLTEFCRDNGLTKIDHTEDECIESAASRLAREEVIGWVYGRMEIGPRALTHRSILAHPGINKDKVNLVKRRESFRPFAPIVRRDKLGDIFEGGPPDSPHMLYKYSVKSEYLDKLKGVVHVDRSSRVQTIDGERELAKTWKLLAAFEGRTGLPVLLNTSFNMRGQPLVSSFRDALEALMTTDLSAVYIENSEIRKQQARKDD
jgi:carbamoyltransferase